MAIRLRCSRFLSRAREARESLWHTRVSRVKSWDARDRKEMNIYANAFSMLSLKARKVVELKSSVIFMLYHEKALH